MLTAVIAIVIVILVGEGDRNDAQTEGEQCRRGRLEEISTA
jgi:hypothetical protein